MSPRGTMTMQLPPFRGAVRRLVIVLAALFFGLALVDYASTGSGAVLRGLLLLEPAAVLGRGWVWQLVTYPFLNTGKVNTAFALLTLWFTGSVLEEARGKRWFVELFYGSATVGALIACVLGALPMWTGGRVSIFDISSISASAGLQAPLFGVLCAFAVLFGDVEFLLFFVLRLKAKYMVAIGALIYLATLVRERDSFSALLTLCCGVCGLVFARMASRSGVTGGIKERYYGARNDYTRWKRRRAARKFEVYMRKQDRIVKFDDEGRYIAPEDERRDPSDKKWMN